MWGGPPGPRPTPSSASVSRVKAGPDQGSGADGGVRPTAINHTRAKGTLRDMSIHNRFPPIIAAPAAICFALTVAFGQIGPPSGQGQTTRVNQLPLSGRTGQSGSVTAIESPV